LWAYGIRSALSLHVYVRKHAHSGARGKWNLGICEAALSMCYFLGGEIYSGLQ